LDRETFETLGVRAFRSELSPEAKADKIKAEEIQAKQLREKAKLEAQVKLIVERQIEAERIATEKQAEADAKVAKEKAEGQAREAARIEAERIEKAKADAEIERCVLLCRKMPTAKDYDVQYALTWIQWNAKSRLEPMEIFRAARQLDHISVNDIGYYGADMPEPVPPPPIHKLQKPIRISA
jgi:hypothetical protein